MYFQGQMDELRIWNVARSDCQIASNMNATYTSPVSNLVAYYNFNEGTAGGNNAAVTSLPDQSPFNNTGTLTNFALNGPNSNWVASTAAINAMGGSGGSVTLDSASVCSGDTFTFPDGSAQVITATVTQTSLLQSSSQCDSTVITTVDVIPAAVVQVADSVCPGASYTFPDGSMQTITSGPVIQTSLLSTAQGCDSTIITTVDVFSAPVVQVQDTVCAGTVYVFPDSTSQTINTGPVTYTSLLSTVQGCDSTVISVVFATTVDTSVSPSGMVLTASATNATYQWLDCDSSFAPIPNATSASFQPATTGNYAVAVTQNGCTDTSSCYFVNTVSVEAGIAMEVRAYPNPAEREIRVEAGGLLDGSAYLLDVRGKVLQTAEMEAGQAVLNLEDLPQAVYLLRVEGNGQQRVLRIVKM